MTSSDALAWLTAIGTFVAAVVPLVFFLIERRDRRSAEAKALNSERLRAAADHGRWEAEERYRREELERRRLNDEAELSERRRSQAEAIHLWRTPDDGWVLALANPTRLPVFKVHLFLDGGFFSRLQAVEGEDPDSDELLWAITVPLIAELDVLPPTGEKFFSRPLEQFRAYANGESLKPPRPLVRPVTPDYFAIHSMLFTDASGTRWSRSFDGQMLPTQLEECGDSERWPPGISTMSQTMMGLFW